MADSVSILNPVRSLETFGVAGLLGDDCRVFYETLFSTQSIGRVSDVVVSQLKGARPDEFKVRLVLLHACFEAYRQSTGQVPVQFECGVDSTRLAIGISFRLPATLNIDWKGLDMRVGLGHTKTLFEATLHQVGKVSDALVVRYEASTQQIEIVSILDLRKVAPVSRDKRVEFMFVEIKQEREAPKAAQYVELGDTAYHILEKRAGPQSQQEEEFRKALSGMDALDGDTRVGGGNADEGNNVVRLKGRVEGEKGPAVQRITGTVKNLFKGLFGRKNAVANSGSIDPVDAELVRLSGAQELSEPTPAAVVESAASLSEEAFANLEGSPDGGAAPTSVNAEEFNEVTKNFDALTTEGSDQLEQLQDQLRNELKSDTAKRLFDQTVAAVIAERSKIKEMSRRMTSMVRQKELEVQSKENTFKEAMRERNDQVRQRDTMIQRMREQLQQAAAEMERLKQLSLRRADTNPVMKQKLTQIQTELNVSRETNGKLTAKIEELKTKLSSERVSRSYEKSSESSQAQELLSTKQQYERVSRMAEELKKNNQRLMERVDQLNKKQAIGTGTDVDAKLKLANAGKMLASTKKDNEKLNATIMQMKADELKLKGEMNQINKELARTKSLLAQAKLAIPAAKPAPATPTSATATAAGPATKEAAAKKGKDPKAA